MKILKKIKNKILFENSEELKTTDFVFYKYSLGEKNEITEEEYKSIIYDLSLEKALHIISKKNCTKKEIKEKLKIKEKEILEKVIEKLEQDGYINEAEYAFLFITSKKYGRKRAEYELLQKGISHESIDESYIKAGAGIEKKNMNYWLEKIKEKEYKKKINFLLNKGFDDEEIAEVVKSN